MKKKFGLVLAIVLSLSALLLSVATLSGWVSASPRSQGRATPNIIISYQGNIYEDDAAFDGTGYFKFAIVDSIGSTTYWSNDDTSSAGSEPSSSIPLPVEHGLFSINLGDISGTYTGMSQAISYTTFEEYPTLLRVWFSPDDVTFTQMPDQQIATVPYALQAVESVYASSAENSTMLNYLESSAYQLRVSGVCPAGYAVSEVNSDGSVECQPVENKPVFSVTSIQGGSPTTGRFGSITIGTDGLGLISYRDDANKTLMVAHCENIACTAYSTSTIYEPLHVDVGYYTSITIGSDGLGIISFIDETNHALLVAHCDDIACTSAETNNIYTVGVSGNLEYQRTNIAIDREGYPLISYYSHNGSDLRLTRCSDLTCDGSKTSYLVDSANEVGIFPSMVVAQNTALIAHYDETNGNLRLSYFNLLSNSPTSTIVLDSAGDVGYHPAIALGKDGNPVIAYTEYDVGKINVIHCNNFTCDTHTTTELLNLGDSYYSLGYGTSIAIGSDGLPLISLIRYSDSTLLAIKCTSMDCASDPIIEIVATSVYATNHTTSIAIGMDGYPLISYYTPMATDLLVAHCSSDTCQPYDWGK